jgi:hypothetical protein
MLEIRVSSEVDQGRYRADLHLAGLFVVEGCYCSSFRGLELVLCWQGDRADRKRGLVGGMG